MGVMTIEKIASHDPYPDLSVFHPLRERLFVVRRIQLVFPVSMCDPVGDLRHIQGKWTTPLHECRRLVSERDGN